MSSEEDKTKSEANASDVKQNSQQATDKFPLAEVRQAASAGILQRSSMWWVTLICLLGAVFLAWKSMPQTGTEITIHFPEGHGLKPDDAVRYRGIEVGRVTSVALNEDLTGIDVRVMLNPGGGALDREGTRFWIVRPRLSLTEVSGLETAVGSKYIGVSPAAQNAARRVEFEGLASVPPDELDHGGLEIILRSDDRHGASPGAPVTWRGVKAGKVLSVNLSPDARHVNVTVRIDRAYRRLVRPSSKFWVTSGFGVDLSLTGLKLNAQSLTTIIQGGVSFISPPDQKEQEPVTSGHVFLLADSVDEEWLKSAANIPLVDFALPETVVVNGERKSSILGISRSKEFTQTGLLVADSAGAVLLTPTLPPSDDGSVLTDFQVLANQSDPLVVSGARTEECQSAMSGMSQVSTRQATAALPWTAFRTPSTPEDCLVVRSAVVDGKATPLIQPVDLEQISLFENNWVIQIDDADFSEWHGAPVVSMADGKIIGFLQIDSGRPTVVLYSSGA